MESNTRTQMQGKVVVVTGATAGIGMVTALELARMGATVIGVGRNAEKCAAVARELCAATGNPNIDFRVADLSSQSEIRSLADSIRRDLSRLDVLVNNAGALNYAREETVDGLERTFALNHLNYFLLTSLLLDLLKSGAPSRIVNVSSAAHTSGTIRFDDLQSTRGYSGLRAYSQSKLANVLFSNELARRLEGTGVTSNSLHPGFVATNFGHSGRLMGAIMSVAHRLFAISPENGARTEIYLAASPDVEGVTGKYFDKCKAVAPAAAALDLEVASRLWRVSEELTSKTE